MLKWNLAGSDGPDRSLNGTSRTWRGRGRTPSMPCHALTTGCCRRSLATSRHFRSERSFRRKIGAERETGTGHGPSECDGPSTSRRGQAPVRIQSPRQRLAEKCRWRNVRLSSKLISNLFHDSGMSKIICMNSRRGQHTAREDQIFSYILAFLTRIWPARHLKKAQCGRRT